MFASSACPPAPASTQRPSPAPRPSDAAPSGSSSAVQVPAISPPRYSKPKGPKRPKHPSKAASCDSCRAKKRACDTQSPCGACTLNGQACTYNAVDPQVRLERLLAIEAADVERTIAIRDLRNDSQRLLAQVDALKTRLRLSEDDLSEMYDAAEQRMLADKPEFDKRRLRDRAALVAAAPPSTRRGTPLRAEPPCALPPLPELRGLLASTQQATLRPRPEQHQQPQRSIKRARSWGTDDNASNTDDDASGSSRDPGSESASEMPPPRRTSRPPVLVPVRASPRRASASSASPSTSSSASSSAPGPPPLPPSDPTGRPWPVPAAYHFPRSYPMPPHAPMLAPPAWMGPLLVPTLYPVLPVPRGLGTWEDDARAQVGRAAKAVGLGGYVVGSGGAAAGRGGGDGQGGAAPRMAPWWP